MDSPVVVLCTFPDVEVARRVAGELVTRRLAACVNLVPGVESIYRWEGEVERSGEVLGLIKTTCYPELEAGLKELHPYEVPEIVALPVGAGLPAYLAWLGESCGNA
ncbi:divalent-cation tolerance protein CutA [Luteolibacter marinus]|uniref:divalent-cation tolerance protein CutA n=1 Tax=Luteolibacter marinus TaxID=2776705 RepID=UPI00186940FE|nr:divalent-cation tolerance protein CutA [Luteolibacter marinus]